MTPRPALPCWTWPIISLKWRANMVINQDDKDSRYRELNVGCSQEFEDAWCILIPPSRLWWVTPACLPRTVQLDSSILEDPATVSHVCWSNAPAFTLCLWGFHTLSEATWALEVFQTGNTTIGAFLTARFCWGELYEMVSFLSCSKCSVSLSYALYHLPQLFTGTSETVGISVPSMWNLLRDVAFDNGDAPALAGLYFPSCPCALQKISFKKIIIIKWGIYYLK